MPLRPLRLPAITLVASIALSPVVGLAQGVSTSELWAAWQEGVSKRGGALTAQSLREGNKLTLSHVHFEPVIGAGVFEIEQVALIGQADGSVAVNLPETFPVVLDLPATPGQSGRREMVLAVSAPKLDFIVRGLGARADFQLNAPELTLRLERMLPEPGPDDLTIGLTAKMTGADLRFLQDLALEVPILDGALVFAHFEAEMQAATRSEDDPTQLTFQTSVDDFSGTLSGAYPLSGQDLWHAVQRAMQGEAALFVAPSALPAPEQAAEVPTSVAGGAAADLSAPAEATAPPAVDEAALAPAAPPSLLASLAQGLRSELKISHGALQAGLSATGADGAPVSLALAVTSGKGNFGFDQAKAAVDLLLEGVALSGAVAGFALPQDAGLALPQLSLAATLGLNDLRGPQNWSLSYAVNDLTLPERFWQGIDPQNVLVQAPISLAAALSGQYQIDADVLQAGVWPAKPSTVFSHFSLALDSHLLKVLGLVQNGQGRLDLSPQEPGLFAEIPQTMGKLRLSTSGAYALLDQLAAAGLIDAEAMSAYRGTLMMIGQAGETPDVLSTELDFREEGFFLNGHKLR